MHTAEKLIKDTPDAPQDAVNEITEAKDALKAILDNNDSTTKELTEATEALSTVVQKHGQAFQNQKAADTDTQTTEGTNNSDDVVDAEFDEDK